MSLIQPEAHGLKAVAAEPSARATRERAPGPITTPGTPAVVRPVGARQRLPGRAVVGMSSSVAR
jgi:hypothetical protein